MSDKHDRWSPTVDLKEQREQETHGPDPRAYSKFSEMMAECILDESTVRELNIYDLDPAYKYLDDNRIDHTLPNGIKVTYFNEGRFKK